MRTTAALVVVAVLLGASVVIQTWRRERTSVERDAAATDVLQVRHMIREHCEELTVAIASSNTDEAPADTRARVAIVWEREGKFCADASPHDAAPALAHFSVALQQYRQANDHESVTRSLDALMTTSRVLYDHP